MMILKQSVNRNDKTNVTFCSRTCFLFFYYFHFYGDSLEKPETPADTVGRSEDCNASKFPCNCRKQKRSKYIRHWQFSFGRI